MSSPAEVEANGQMAEARFLPAPTTRFVHAGEFHSFRARVAAINFLLKQDDIGPSRTEELMCQFNALLDDLPVEERVKIDIPTIFQRLGSMTTVEEAPSDLTESAPAAEPEPEERIEAKIFTLPPPPIKVEPEPIAEQMEEFEEADDTVTATVQKEDLEPEHVEEEPLELQTDDETLLSDEINQGVDTASDDPSDKLGEVEAERDAIKYEQTRNKALVAYVDQLFGTENLETFFGLSSEDKDEVIQRVTNVFRDIPSNRVSHETRLRKAEELKAFLAGKTYVEIAEQSSLSTHGARQSIHAIAETILKGAPVGLFPKDILAFVVRTSAHTDMQSGTIQPDIEQSTDSPLVETWLTPFVDRLDYRNILAIMFGEEYIGAYEELTEGQVKTLVTKITDLHEAARIHFKHPGKSYYPEYLSEFLKGKLSSVIARERSVTQPAVCNGMRSMFSRIGKENLLKALEEVVGAPLVPGQRPIKQNKIAASYGIRVLLAAKKESVAPLPEAPAPETLTQVRTQVADFLKLYDQQARTLRDFLDKSKGPSKLTNAGEEVVEMLGNMHAVAGRCQKELPEEERWTEPEEDLLWFIFREAPGHKGPVCLQIALQILGGDLKRNNLEGENVLRDAIYKMIKAQPRAEK